MQIQRSFFSLFSIFLIGIGIFSPLTMSFAAYDTYDYKQFSTAFQTDSEKKIEKTFTFDSPRTSFSLVFPDFSPESDEDIRVEWIQGGKTFERFLDINDDKDRSVVSTFPFVTTPTESIQVRIFFSKKIPDTVDLITTIEKVSGKKYSFVPGGFVAHADSGVKVISRAEWGADESMRYFSDSYVEKKKSEYIARGSVPREIRQTQAEHDAGVSEYAQMSTINSLAPDARKSISLQRYEGAKKLLWPIEKVKKVEKIVIHHTSEALAQDADDATLVRAIYAYHTKTRGWGDIGYNYVLGQRGQVYEGRAGGDYVQGAHVYGNNAGTVGISVIGNYDTLHLNRDQESGLKNALVWLAGKYGIDVMGNSVAAKVCKAQENCSWKLINTPNLIGHRDIGVTDCPGSNLYTKIPELRTYVAEVVGRPEPVYNYNTIPYDPIAPEDEVKYVIIEKIVTPAVSTGSVAVDTQVLTPSASYAGKSLKIRLSYPSDTITLTTATTKKPTARLGFKITPFAPRDSAVISLSGKDKLSVKIGNTTTIAPTFSLASDVVRIPSWSRIPDWDTSKKYNDNLFRGKIVVRNVGGKLLVVNELPIEDYLRGIGEVSNGDLPEKIKTIIVAARSYATFYQSPKNRKFSTSLYDGSDNPDEFQKYLGYSYEMRSPNTSQMVLATAGEVITYKGSVVKAWYFSSSDGKTRSYLEYCQSNGGKKCEDIPYLQSVEDPAGVGKTRAGHGVGISGIGATYAAGLGKTYPEIIAYYLQGVKVEKLKK